MENWKEALEASDEFTVEAPPIKAAAYPVKFEYYLKKIIEEWDNDMSMTIVTWEDNKLLVEDYHEDNWTSAIDAAKHAAMNH